MQLMLMFFEQKVSNKCLTMLDYYLRNGKIAILLGITNSTKLLFLPQIVHWIINDGDFFYFGLGGTLWLVGSKAFFFCLFGAELH